MGNDNNESDLDPIQYSSIGYRRFSRPTDEIESAIEGATDDWITVLENEHTTLTVDADEMQKELEEMTRLEPKLEGSWKDEFEQKHMLECPECGDDFMENNDEVVEADDGELYCSLACLNESLMN